MTRPEANNILLEKLKTTLEKYPDLRFIQALWALGIIDKEDRFYEEPEKTIERIYDSV